MSRLPAARALHSSVDSFWMHTWAAGLAHGLHKNCMCSLKHHRSSKTRICMQNMDSHILVQTTVCSLISQDISNQAEHYIPDDTAEVNFKLENHWQLAKHTCRHIREQNILKHSLLALHSPCNTPLHANPDPDSYSATARQVNASRLA